MQEEDGDLKRFNDLCTASGGIVYPALLGKTNAPEKTGRTRSLLQVVFIHRVAYTQDWSAGRAPDSRRFKPEAQFVLARNDGRTWASIYVSWTP